MSKASGLSYVLLRPPDEEDEDIPGIWAVDDLWQAVERYAHSCHEYSSVNCLRAPEDVDPAHWASRELARHRADVRRMLGMEDAE